MDYLQYFLMLYIKAISISVLNLVINGLPSILILKVKFMKNLCMIVLNLVINGLPSIQMGVFSTNDLEDLEKVLNLVINGLPSILISLATAIAGIKGFKPCYKWITFNTL